MRNQQTQSYESLSSLLKKGHLESKAGRSNTRLLLAAKKLFSHPNFAQFKQICEMVEEIKNGKNINLSSDSSFESVYPLAKKIRKLIEDPMTSKKAEKIMQKYDYDFELKFDASLPSLLVSLEKIKEKSSSKFKALEEAFMEFVGTEESSYSRSKSKVQSRYSLRAERLRSYANESEDAEDEEENEAREIEDLFEDFDTNEDGTLDEEEFETGLEGLDQDDLIEILDEDINDLVDEDHEEESNFSDDYNEVEDARFEDMSSEEDSDEELEEEMEEEIKEIQSSKEKLFPRRFRRAQAKKVVTPKVQVASKPLAKKKLKLSKEEIKANLKSIS